MLLCWPFVCNRIALASHIVRCVLLLLWEQNKEKNIVKLIGFEFLFVCVSPVLLREDKVCSMFSSVLFVLYSLSLWPSINSYSPCRISTNFIYRNERNKEREKKNILHSYAPSVELMFIQLLTSTNITTEHIWLQRFSGFSPLPFLIRNSNFVRF